MADSKATVFVSEPATMDRDDDDDVRSVDEDVGWRERVAALRAKSWHDIFIGNYSYKFLCTVSCCLLALKGGMHHQP